jgi:hypothetical protein
MMRFCYSLLLQHWIVRSQVHARLLTTDLDDTAFDRASFQRSSDHRTLFQHGVAPRALVMHQRRNAAVPWYVAGSTLNACFPIAAQSARACSPRSLWSLLAIQSSEPKIVAQSSPVRSTIPALMTRPPGSIRCRVRLRRSTCHARMSCCALAA